MEGMGGLGDASVFSVHGEFGLDTTRATTQLEAVDAAARRLAQALNRQFIEQAGEAGVALAVVGKGGTVAAEGMTAATAATRGLAQAMVALNRSGASTAKSVEAAALAASSLGRAVTPARIEALNAYALALAEIATAGRAAAGSIVAANRAMAAGMKGATPTAAASAQVRASEKLIAAEEALVGTTQAASRARITAHTATTENLITQAQLQIAALREIALAEQAAGMASRGRGRTTAARLSPALTAAGAGVGTARVPRAAPQSFAPMFMPPPAAGGRAAGMAGAVEAAAATQYVTSAAAASGRKLGFTVAHIGQEINQAATSLTFGLSLPIIALAGFGVKAEAEFSKAMTASLAITDDVSNAMRQKMEDAATAMSEKTRFSAKEIAEAYYFMASAGLDAQRQLAGMPTVIRYAQAADMNAAVATETLANVTAAMGMRSNNAAEDMKNWARAADVLAKAGAVSTGTVKQLGEAMTNYGATTARTYGHSIEQAAAILSVFADIGLKGTKGGTQYRMTMGYLLGSEQMELEKERKSLEAAAARGGGGTTARRTGAKSVEEEKARVIQGRKHKFKFHMESLGSDVIKDLKDASDEADRKVRTGVKRAAKSRKAPYVSLWTELKLTSYDEEGNAKSLADIIQRFEELKRDRTTKEFDAILTRLKIPTKGRMGLLGLIGRSGELRAREELLKLAGGSAQVIADKQVKNLQDQLKILGNVAQNTMRRFGKAMTPVIEGDLIPWLKKAAGGIGGLIDKFASLPPAARASAAKWIAAVALFGPGMRVIGASIQGVGAVIAGYHGLAQMFRTVAAGGLTPMFGSKVARSNEAYERYSAQTASYEKNRAARQAAETQLRDARAGRGDVQAAKANLAASRAAEQASLATMRQGGADYAGSIKTVRAQYGLARAEAAAAVPAQKTAMTAFQAAAPNAPTLDFAGQLVREREAAREVLREKYQQYKYDRQRFELARRSLAQGTGTQTDVENRRAQMLASRTHYEESRNSARSASVAVRELGQSTTVLAGRQTVLATETALSTRQAVINTAQIERNAAAQLKSAEAAQKATKGHISLGSAIQGLLIVGAVAGIAYEGWNYWLERHTRAAYADAQAQRAIAGSYGATADALEEEQRLLESSIDNYQRLTQAKAAAAAGEGTFSLTDETELKTVVAELSVKLPGLAALFKDEKLSVAELTLEMVKLARARRDELAAARERANWEATQTDIKAANAKVVEAQTALDKAFAGERLRRLGQEPSLEWMREKYRDLYANLDAANLAAQEAYQKSQQEQDTKLAVARATGDVPGANVALQKKAVLRQIIGGPYTSVANNRDFDPFTALTMPPLTEMQNDKDVRASYLSRLEGTVTSREIAVGPRERQRAGQAIFQARQSAAQQGQGALEVLDKYITEYHRNVKGVGGEVAPAQERIGKGLAAYESTVIKVQGLSDTAIVSMRKVGTSMTDLAAVMAAAPKSEGFKNIVKDWLVASSDPKLTEEAKKLGGIVAAALDQMQPETRAAATDTINALSEQFLIGVPAIQNDGAMMGQGVVDGIRTQIPSAYQAGVEMREAYRQGLAGEVPLTPAVGPGSLGEYTPAPTPNPYPQARSLRGAFAPTGTGGPVPPAPQLGPTTKEDMETYRLVRQGDKPYPGESDQERQERKLAYLQKHPKPGYVPPVRKVPPVPPEPPRAPQPTQTAPSTRTAPAPGRTAAASTAAPSGNWFQNLLQKIAGVSDANVKTQATAAETAAGQAEANKAGTDTAVQAADAKVSEARGAADSARAYAAMTKRTADYTAALANTPLPTMPALPGPFPTGPAIPGRTPPGASPRQGPLTPGLPKTGGMAGWAPLPGETREQTGKRRMKLLVPGTGTGTGTDGTGTTNQRLRDNPELIGALPGLKMASYVAPSIPEPARQALFAGGVAAGGQQPTVVVNNNAPQQPGAKVNVTVNLDGRPILKYIEDNMATDLVLTGGSRVA